MEFTVKEVMNFEQEIRDSDYPMIRQFFVEKDMSGTPKEKLKNGKWEMCQKNSVEDFSAVGYFFAKKLFNELNIPIGIINTSWGGTCVETWTSKEAFQSSHEFKEMIANLTNIDINELSKSQKNAMTNRIEQLQGSKIVVESEKHFKEPDFNDTA